MVTVQAVQLMVECSDWPIGWRAVATMVLSTAAMNSPSETMAKTRRRRGWGSPASTAGPAWSGRPGSDRQGGRRMAAALASDTGVERGHALVSLSKRVRPCPPAHLTTVSDSSRHLRPVQPQARRRRRGSLPRSQKVGPGSGVYSPQVFGVCPGVSPGGM